MFTCAILDNNFVKCWGRNLNGELGLGDKKDRGFQPGQMGNNLPVVDLGAGRTAKAISAGGSHVCAILDNNTVKCWGGNAYGQLGLGDANARGDAPGEMGGNLPSVDLGVGRTAKAVSAGFLHSCALLDNNSVKCWGKNAAGELGLGDNVQRGDSPGEMGDNLPVVDLGAGRTAKTISAGEERTCAVLDNNTVKCWGNNSFGALGLGISNTLADNRGDQPGEMGDSLHTVNLGTGRTAKATALGYLDTCAYLDNNTVKCWGYNDHGELGQGDRMTRAELSKLGDALPAIVLR